MRLFLFYELIFAKRPKIHYICYTIRKHMAKKKEKEKKKLIGKRTPPPVPPIGHPRWGNPLNPKLYTPETLWQAAIGYFQWVEENPLQEEKVFCNKDGICTHTVNKLRAMTIKGLCIYLDINEDTFLNYEKDPTFFGIPTRIRQIIYEQKFTGAAADLLNSSIIAKELGLKDSTEHSGHITMLQSKPLSKEELKDYNDILEGNV